MTVESADTIGELNAAWPLGSDPKSEGDNHLRLIKSVMQKDAARLSMGNSFAGQQMFLSSVVVQDGVASARRSSLSANGYGVFVGGGADRVAAESSAGLVRVSPDAGTIGINIRGDTGQSVPLLRCQLADASTPLQIGPGGTLGIGVAPDATQNIRLLPAAYSNGAHTLYCVGASNGDAALAVRGDGRVRMVQTYSATSAAAGNVVIDSGGFLTRSTSSGAFKTARQALANTGAVIEALSGLSFLSTHEDDAGRRFTGFVAEDVAAVLPEASLDGGENYDVRALVAVLWEEVKALRARLAAAGV